MNNTYNLIKNLLTQASIPTHDTIFEIADQVSDILMAEKTPYRPAASGGEPGSLLDFHEDKIPMVVVPDLHARPYYLLNILKYKINNLTIFEGLEQKKLRLIFVGDILHSERTSERWAAAQAEFDEDICTGPSISAEMQEGLSLLCGLMKLKSAFPENVHILKGNHENIYNETGAGDFGFRKYADEGNMCRIFIQEYYGDDILYMIHCFEKALPLLAFGRKVIVSHAEPALALNRKQLIEARYSSGVVESLTWTANDAANPDSVEKIIKNLTGREDAGDYLYIGGHRPVSGKYRLRQNGLFVQIHNPSEQHIAIVYNEKKFNPDTDIVEVSHE